MLEVMVLELLSRDLPDPIEALERCDGARKGPEAIEPGHGHGLARADPSKRLQRPSDNMTNKAKGRAAQTSPVHVNKRKSTKGYLPFSEYVAPAYCLAALLLW